MDFRFKFDKTSIKIGTDGKIEFIENKNSPGTTGFLEINLDFLYMAYQMFPPYLPSYFTTVQQTINKYIYKGNQPGTYENIADKPGIIPATGNDIYNYVARYGMANFQIQTVMRLDGKLDRNKLLKAVQLSVETEPVFGCRFVENQPPYWKPLDNIHDVPFCTFEDTNNPEEAIQKFLESPLDMDRDPMVKIRLISTGNQDILCLKINHTCCDGSGVKEYLQLLSNLYSNLNENTQAVIPKPNIQSKKDQEILFQSLGIKDPEALRNPLQDTPKTMWTFPWRCGKPGTVRVSVDKLPKGNINAMSRYAKARGASINDLVVTALYRAMFEMSHPPRGTPMDISMTVDLRRYLPDQKTEAIRNFSGGFNTKLPRISNESFEGTLSRVVSMMNNIKNGTPGLQSALGLDFVEKDDFHQSMSFYKTISQLAIQISGYFRHCAPVLSNLGFIDKSLLKFGDTTVTDAYIIPPALCAPGILLCIGTYNDEVTMSVSYYEEQVQRDQMERLLGLIKNELLESCKN